MLKTAYSFGQKIRTDGRLILKRVLKSSVDWNYRTKGRDQWRETFLHSAPRTKVKCKGTVRPITGHEGPEGEKRYSSTLSLTLALDGGGWLTSRPGHFTLGKETRYPLYRRLGGPQGRSGWVRKISSHRDCFSVLYPYVYVLIVLDF